MDLSFLTDTLSKDHAKITETILSDSRVSEEDCLTLFREFDLGILGLLADHVRKKINGENVFFNRNIHLEPTNICIHNCLFCSYSRKTGEEGAWEHNLDSIREIVMEYKNKNITEIHVVGGVHPNRSVHYYAELLKIIREELPSVHIKAFTAVEIEHMALKAHLSVKEALELLKKAGLNSIPGGGAEIFDETLRQRICPDKTGSGAWLKVHEDAHNSGLQSNCTILYGHMEDYSHRVDHLERLRSLQDQTGGFNAFIPLKYKSKNNDLSEFGEVSPAEDLRNYAVSRIFLDNIPHLKAYWPMTGKDLAAISLSFGVDDLDGTIQDTTKIYSMAGSSEQNPGMTAAEIVELIKKGGRIPVERDSLYNPLKIYSI